jgi:hypothetical protein
MNKSVMRFGLASLAAIILATVPSNVAGQTTNKPLADKKTVSPSSETNAPDRLLKAGPFHGKLAAIDKVGKTITVGKRTFQITSETKIKKAGKPATLEDGAVGETVSGYVKPMEGKLAATTISFGPKPTEAGKDKPKPTPEKEAK